ncbi:MAG: hypothetical protein ACYSU0_02860 [Planctomycetota bacterium]|jgi:hypothetical protein
MRHFDYESVAREAGISAEDLAEISRLVRQDFPADDMLFELHVLRACMAVKDKRYSLQQTLEGLATAHATGV